jgi:AmmeMemoRadiSam system protein A
VSEGYLSEDEGLYLLQLARHTIEAALDSGTLPPPSPPSIERLQAPGASFVTLTLHGGALRGCIGSLVARRPLVEDIRANALAAAFEDPRFSPLTREELPYIAVEISVLTEPEPLTYRDPQDLIAQLRPHVDGVVIQQGWRRATFLPQVWEQLPIPDEFLSHLCYKAGLPAAAWQKGDLAVSVYQVRIFEEEG